MTMQLQALRFHDDKSDKYWSVEMLGSDLAVRHGKTGSIGKVQLHEMESAADAQREATKLVASKTRKGYVPFPGFDPMAQFYLDDLEAGPHRLTSHPVFRQHFTSDLYYDCGDEEAPFGSDEGADTLSFLELAIRANHQLDFAAFPAHLVAKEWEMHYLPATETEPSLDSVREVVKTSEMDLTQSDMVTYAAAFAQIKITGSISPLLGKRALNAMARMALVAQICDWGPPSEIQQQMRAELKAFCDSQAQ